MKISKSAAKFSLKFIIFALCLTASALLLHLFWKSINTNANTKYKSVVESTENVSKYPNIIIDAGHGASGKT